MLTSQPAPDGTLLFISPHLDDVVFSCGRLLSSSAEKRVLTVFAADPPQHIALTPWDKDCGFDSSAAAMKERRAEDSNALKTLDAIPQWLDFPDSQYCSGRAGPTPHEIAQVLSEEILHRPPHSVFFPLGLFHSDHELVHSAALLMLQDESLAKLRWYVYADALYRSLPELLEKRLASLDELGIEYEPVSFIETEHASAEKMRAVACYASQLRALDTPSRLGSQDLSRPESYWRLSK